MSVPIKRLESLRDSQEGNLTLRKTPTKMQFELPSPKQEAVLRQLCPKNYLYI